MKKYYPVLKRCALFHHIDETDLETLFHCLDAQVMHFEKKYTILAEGSPASYIGVVLSGSVQVMKIDYYGNRMLLTHILPGQIFGEAFACAGLKESPVSVVANDSCEVLLLNYGRIMRSCKNVCSFHQQLTYNLMQTLAIKNIQFHQKLEITSKRTTREKLLAYLFVQAKQSGSKQFEIPFDRQELADYLQVDRSGLSAEISKLRAEGILNSQKRMFELL